VDAASEVLAANRRYYEAFEAADLDAMAQIWERSARVTCTHPGWPTRRSWGQVAASFFALFQGGALPQFLITEEQVVVSGDTAWVSLDENLLGQHDGVTVAAVNIFVRDPAAGRWAMVCHLGSAVQATLS